MRDKSGFRNNGRMIPSLSPGCSNSKIEFQSNKQIVDELVLQNTYTPCRESSELICARVVLKELDKFEEESSRPMPPSHKNWKQILSREGESFKEVKQEEINPFCERT